MTKRTVISGMLAFLLLAVPLGARGQDFATDLNGFRLWQFASVVRAQFGDPFESRTADDGSVAEIYPVNDRSYMVIERLAEYPDNIFSLQITGYPVDMKPFRGVVLGDPEKKVFDALGTPNKTEKLADPPVTVCYFDNGNYKVEIDGDGRLYSIKMFLSKEFMQAGIEAGPWEAFKKAVLARDVPAVLALLRPDVELYKDGKVLFIDKRHDDFLAGPDKEVVNALIGETGSVYAELKATEPEGEMRLAEKVGIGQVFKFYKGKILKEIVFFPYAGKYRVYEIAFRNLADEKTRTKRP